MIKRLAPNEVQLCTNGTCCPTIIKIDEENYEVFDDHGNKIRVKKAELHLVADAVKELDKSQTAEQLIYG